MRALVIYKSKTGYTKKYAEWIADELGADILEVSKATVNMLTSHDIIIYGGSLHAVGINGIKFIMQNLDKLKGKKVIVFATGASPVREETINEVRNRNFTVQQQSNIRFFYLRGGFDYKRLNLFDKLLMLMLKWKINKKKELTADEKGMLAIYDKAVDYTKKNNIDEIINYAIS